jgi:hypothetical protein
MKGEKMKVDQYRVLKDEKYSFLVPSGMNLEDFDEPEAGYLEVFQPFVLEHENIDLEEIVIGQEFGTAIEDLENDRLTVVFTIPRPTEEELNSDGIG